MKRILDGKIYDTETATVLVNISGRGGTLNRGDLGYEDTWLYRSPTGTFFMAGEGGSASRWAKPFGENGSAAGEGLLIISDAEARHLYERHGGVVEKYAKYFGEPEIG